MLKVCPKGAFCVRMIGSGIKKDNINQWIKPFLEVNTNMIKHTLQIGFLGFACVFSGMTTASIFDFSSAASSIDAQAKLLSAKAQNLSPQVVKLGLEAYDKARAQGLDAQQLLTIVDYSKPSTEPRLWVLDLKTDKVLFQELVAHAQNSGGNIPTTFSDTPSSHMSSLGLYLTEQTYDGHHGNTLRLAGLEKGFNDKAQSREIVMHAANYVSQTFADIHGRLGRSWGCFALNPAVAQPVINTIKGGTLLFAYYPEQSWLEHSSYLT